MPISTPAPAHPLGDTSGRGWSLPPGCDGSKESPSALPVHAMDGQNWKSEVLVSVLQLQAQQRQGTGKGSGKSRTIVLDTGREIEAKAGYRKGNRSKSNYKILLDCQIQRPPSWFSSRFSTCLFGDACCRFLVQVRYLMPDNLYLVPGISSRACQLYLGLACDIMW